MKIAMILTKNNQTRIFSDAAFDRLRAIGEVVCNETDETTPETIIPVLAGADIAVTSWGNGSLTEEILQHAPNLKLIVHAAGSVKPVVSDAVWERGIRLAGSAKPLSEGVSDTALGLSICACKNIFNLTGNVAAGGWGEGKEDIRELFDITVGVVGAGWAGRHYIELMKNFHVSILLYDPYVSEEEAAAMGVQKVTLEALLRTSDLISIHAPSIPETFHMFHSETLAMMKKDAILINTARGSLIDEQALYEHMKAGGLKYACLDVTDPEPPRKDHPLRSLPNVIFTPHLAGQVNNGLRRIGIHVTEEIPRFLQNEKLLCEVTRDMLATMA